MNDLTVLEEGLLETNVGFKFLYDNTQTQSSAMMKLQWCVAPQIIKYLKDNKADNALVFISIKNPNGNERRQVVPFTSPQELIEFHCPGEHIISAVIVWGDQKWSYLSDVKNMFLKQYSMYSYVFRNIDSVVEGSYGMKKLGKAEMSATVADGHFAPKLSDRERWYLTLIYDNPMWNECEIKKRRWLVYPIQTMFLACWIPIIFMVRLISAVWFGILLARKDVEWKAVIHPFSNETIDVSRRSKERWKGEILKQLFFVPLSQITLASVCLGIGHIVSKIMAAQTSSVSTSSIGLGIYSYLFLLAIPLVFKLCRWVIKTLSYKLKQIITIKVMSPEKMACLRAE